MDLSLMMATLLDQCFLNAAAPISPLHNAVVIEDLLRRQLQNIKHSSKEKGKKPRYRTPPATLVANHVQSNAGAFPVQKNTNLLRQTVVSHEYQPSRRSFDELLPIMIADLLLETVHKDAYIVLRTISEPYRSAGMTVVVEDSRGMANLLSLYNVNVGLDDGIFLPCGSYIALRAPYYKLSANGNPMIRVDHPSDVVRLDAGHNLVAGVQWVYQKGTILDEQDPSGLKEEGNVLFRAGQYLAAATKYTAALDSPAIIEGSELWRMLICNRARARLHMSQFDGAIADCEMVIQRSQNTQKAVYTKGCALYNLRKHEEACAALEGLVAQGGANREVVQDLQRATRAAKESKVGDYDFRKMRREAKKQRFPRLSHGDYIGPVEFRQCGSTSKGRGAFATRDIEQGELVLCEKAILVAYHGEPESNLITINTVKNRVYGGPDSLVAAKLVQLLYDNPSMAGAFFNLHSGGRSHTGQAVSFTDEGQPIIDAFTVGAILDYNAFKPENTADVMEGAGDAFDAVDLHSDAGIWLRASYFNHSCTANVLRTFIGDFVVMRALRSIKAGEELEHSYVPSLSSFKERSEAIHKYGFTCSCELCSLQRAVTPKEVQARERAMRAFQNLRDELRHPSAPLTASTINRARLYMKNIRRTYSIAKFCDALLLPCALVIGLQCGAGQKEECISTIADVIKLTCGADVKDLDSFEPVLWTAELMHLLLTLCVLYEDTGYARRATRCRDTCRRLYGITSGLGYDATQIEEVMKLHRQQM